MIFTTFADSRNASAIRRICRQAKKLQKFSNTIGFTENELDEKFRLLAGNRLNASVRGFGFWVWKPQVILQALDETKANDILLYCDAGCYLNKSGLKRLSDYCEIVRRSESGMLAFSGVPSNLRSRYKNRRYLDLREDQWTKGDVLEFFNIRSCALISETPQITATAIFFRNTPAVRDFVMQWRDICLNHPNLIDDSPSQTPNADSFVEHRHDQSIFSILAKLNGCEQLSYDELFVFDRSGNRGDWTVLKDRPIQARRRFRREPIKRVKRRLNRIYQRLKFI